MALPINKQTALIKIFFFFFERMGEVKEIINIFGGAEGTAGGSFFRELIRVAVFIRRVGALGGGGRKKRSLQTFLLIMYYSCPS